MRPILSTSNLPSRLAETVSAPKRPESVVYGKAGETDRSDVIRHASPACASTSGQASCSGDTA